MNQPIAQLCQIIIDKLNLKADQSITELLNEIKPDIAANPDLIGQLKSDLEMLQWNQDNSEAYQTLVKGGVAYIGTQVKISPDILEMLLEHFFRELKKNLKESDSIKRVNKKNRFGSCKSESLQDHKYNSLVSLKFDFCKSCSSSINRPNLATLMFDISFGEVEEKIIYRNNFGIKKTEGYIRFGVKFGELHLNLSNKNLKFDQFKDLDTEKIFLKICGQMNCIGEEQSPKWQFKAESENNRSGLFGSLAELELGSVEFLNFSKDNLYQIESLFKVNGIHNLVITEHTNVWEQKLNQKKIKETKLRAFLKKVVEPKLKDYLNKSILEYRGDING